VTRSAKFFKSRLGFGGLLRMLRTRLQARQAQLVQPPADGVLVHLHLEPARHLGFQVHAAPAHHAMHLGVGALDHQLAQLGHLPRVQGRRPTGARAGLQALHPLGIVAMHPVAQGLPIHPVQHRRLGSRMPIENQRQGQQPANLRPVRAAAAQRAQLPARVVVSGDLQPRHQRLRHAIRHTAALIQMSASPGIPQTSHPPRGLA